GDPAGQGERGGGVFHVRTVGWWTCGKSGAHRATIVRSSWRERGGAGGGTGTRATARTVRRLPRGAR
ncbi:hypothetical protein AB0K87_24920, partial [Streptomyces sp. NPDC053705]|uniref:hypothetical protein n=1 Tax=Streptomyces sp. NPDC053705 TaxID=3156668 RepID=UPI0034451081